MNAPVPGIGDNTKMLRSVIDRVERLQEERAGINSDIRDILKEAKGNGFDIKAIREVLRAKKLSSDARRELEDARTTYLESLDLI